MRLFIGSVLLLVSLTAALGQSGMGSVTGIVVDASDSVLPGAEIKIIQLSTNSERTTLSNDAGVFVLPSLVPSTYSLSISYVGFRTRVFSELRLNAFQNIALGRIQLAVAEGPATTVDVKAEVPRIITENAVRNETIQSKQVTEMPLQGRNWTTLLKIIPGSNPMSTLAINGREADSTGLADFSVNGKPANQTQVNLDGGSNIDHGSDVKTTVTPSLESIQEVAVLTNNYQAEYGNRAGGAVINIVTKSGTNKWSGTAWNYMRNEALNATPWTDTFFGRGNPRYRYNYFGGNLGGPILRDKLFFFFNHENLKQDTPTVRTQTRVPTELERLGDFSQTINANGSRPTIYMPGSQASGKPQQITDRIIPANLIHPLGTAIMNLYPLPNLKNETNNNYLNEYSKNNKRYLNVAKIDWNVNESTRAYVRFSYDYQNYRDMVNWAAGRNLPFLVTGWNRPDYAMAVNVTRTFSNALVAETLFNWQYDFVDAPIDVLPDPDRVNPDNVGLGGLPLAFPTQSKILPQFSGTGYQDFNFNRFPWYAKAPEYQIAQTWSWLHGSHLIKWGGQYIQNKKDEINGSIDKGNFNFGINTASAFDTGYSPSNIVTGALNQFAQVNNLSHKLSKFQDLHFFVQDTWRASRTLTLDYGIRVYHIPTERNTVPGVTMDAVFVPSLWDPAKAPRFYIPDPKNPKGQLIDPAFPDQPLPKNMFAALLYTLVPGSGDLMNGVVPMEQLADKAGIRNPDTILVSPRGGIAWQFRTGTVLRAGFGWSYGRPTIGHATGTFQNGLADSVDYRQTSLSTLTSSPVARMSPRNFGAMDEASNAVPTVYDFSLSIQHQLPFDTVLDLAYVGNIQKHQTMQFNINNVLPGTTWKPEFIDPRVAGNNFAGPVSASNPGPLPGTQTVDKNLMRPFPGLGNLNLITNVGAASYNSLQWSLTKRYGHGLAFQFVHTWSKLLTEVQGPGHFYYRWRDYTGFVADEFRPHVVAINYTYDVPKLSQRLGWNNAVARQLLDGWGIAHLVNFYSGRLQTPTMALQYANNTQGVANLNSIFTGSPDVAPRLIPTGNPNTGSSNLAAWFDVNAFELPDLSALGMGSRNMIRSPGTLSNDINITKRFPIRETMGLELRASFFNAFNQVRRQDVNLGFTYKMKGSSLADGYYLLNTPQGLLDTLVANKPNANEAEKYNQYRNGVGHSNITSVLDMRRIEIGMRFTF